MKDDETHKLVKTLVDAWNENARIIADATKPPEPLAVRILGTALKGIQKIITAIRRPFRREND